MNPKRILVWSLIFYVVNAFGAAHAGEIRIVLPDATLKSIIDDACGWSFWGQADHCEAERNGGPKTSEGKASWFIQHWLTPLADKTIFFAPGQHAPDLASLGGKILIRYDTYPDDWPKNDDVSAPR